MNQELIDKFVAGRLSEAEAEAFEEYCVANPEFAKQVEYEQRLKIGIALVSRGSTAEFVRSPVHHPVRWNIAAAAGILLSVFTLYFMWSRYVPTAVKPIMAAVTTDEQRNGASLRLALVRGNEAVPVLPPGITRVEIVGLFDLGFHYSVVLDRLEKTEKVAIATLYSQHPTSPVTIEVMIDGNRLAPGGYLLRVRRQASDEESLDFGFIKP